MSRADRIGIIKQIEALRTSTVICYLTSIRPNLNAQMSEDAVRVMFDQMLRLPKRPVENLDIFLCSNGGNGTVPWRLISLFREYASRVSVLLPYRAYSAATLLALGADEIVMHPFAEMGPIDPTVTNEYNPVETPSNRRLGISVEDVKAYIAFIKNTVGIQNQPELIKAVEALITKIHPLALGNVERFLAQSRMIAEKIMRTHMPDAGSTKQIEEIIDTLASKLYFHGHPINRQEARKELGLKVLEKVPEELETAMWKLYEDFEVEMENRTIFDPMSAIYTKYPAPTPTAPNPMGQITPSIVPPGTNAESDMILAMVESAAGSSRFTQKTRIVVASVGQSGEPTIRQETLAQGWQHS
jgi:hypothetical protein